jgi:hypothetical protein
VFHEIPESILAKMDELERRDAIDRVDGTAMRDRLRQIPPIGTGEPVCRQR